MIVCTKFQGNPANRCWVISVCTKAVDRLYVQQSKTNDYTVTVVGAHWFLPLLQVTMYIRWYLTVSMVTTSRTWSSSWKTYITRSFSTCMTLELRNMLALMNLAWRTQPVLTIRVGKWEKEKVNWRLFADTMQGYLEGARWIEEVSFC